ncbi:probable F-box protein At3g61730 isoform X2 [Pyrus x bretschneideri]|uniref:probable F-box protein At3g61730 isoform X2 n=1 Tax=Pyrus x bretschneideri TaxID=225117 RepID=UPI00202DC1B7|nr:probable F-box protein At3g61730 isoform X2 [Pyrus x bretschneideri]
MFRQQKKHIDWMRIGAFSVESSEAFLTEKLIKPSRLPDGESIQKMLESCGSCVLDKVKTGIWIADLQLARCHACELNTCDGTMQTVDARHIELFLSEGYKNGSRDCELIGRHDVNEHANGACGAIFDMKHLKDSSTSGHLNFSGAKQDQMDEFWSNSS